jgi:predicted amidophosphoribosyltransferase
MIESFLDFVFPTACAVCKIPPSPLCDSCAPAFGVTKSSLEGTPVWYATEYSEPISRILTAYKDQNRTALITYLAPGLLQAVAEAVLHLGSCSICVPPRNQINFRKRGFDPVLSLITAGDKLALRHLPINTLRFQRQVRDQRRLDKPERVSNLLGSMKAIPGSKRVLLVDDVMTTGSTLKECMRALGAAGYEVAGICVLAKRNI